jgi:heme/copper-type cytochrome/quinol oxidase subunit 1
VIARLRAPGLRRGVLAVPLGVGFAYALVIAVRAASGLHHVVDGVAILQVALISAPFAFLFGLGAFDYWFYWAAGRPTRVEDHSGHGARSWKDYFRVNTDHKVIGVQYTVHSVLYFLIGGLFAMLMRAQLAQPGGKFVDANTFNGLFSVHATLMIFLFIIPVFAGLANFVLPLMIGAPDMAFPRLNALSFWLLPIAGLMILGSFFAPGGSFASGWTAYAPLSTTAPLGQVFFTLGVQFAGASSIATALNFLVTIITMRAPGMSFFRMPLLVWANFSTSLLVVIATPFIAASQFFVLLDRALGFNFFNAGHGGDVLMYQHVFWFYSHPAVYIMMLPGFGIVSDLDTPMLWALGFITMFTLGGISGVMLAMVPFDIHVSKTYFIVAHIHYVLFGGSVFTIFAGIYYWFPKMTGRMYDERLGRWHFWTTLISFNVTFAPMHLIGIQGMPRRVADYSSQFATWNLIITIASFALGLSTLIFVYNMIASWRGGPRTTANPWHGLTLEWQVSSPPPIFNFDTMPTIVGGPYEYGIPGAVHAVFRDGAKIPTPAGDRIAVAQE